MIKVLRVFTILCLLLLSTISYSQVKSYFFAEGSKMMLEGTSNVRDWGVEVNEIDGKINMDENNIESIEFYVLTETLKGTVPGMASHLKKAVKQKQHPKLTFIITEVESFEGGAAAIKGDLTVAGVTKTINVKGNVLKAVNGYEISGENVLKMTDYDITPPKAMFGAVKAVDEFKVIFNIVLQEVSQVR
jgi:polyisoprenoid-binding protein YceI